MAAILNFAWEECFDTNLRTPSTFFLFCSLFWTFWYRWHILTIKIPREFIFEHKHPHYKVGPRAKSVSDDEVDSFACSVFMNGIREAEDMCVHPTMTCVFTRPWWDKWCDLYIQALSVNTRHDPMLVLWWASVEDDGPTLNQHWVNVTCDEWWGL